MFAVPILSQVRQPDKGLNELKGKNKMTKNRVENTLFKANWKFAITRKIIHFIYHLYENNTHTQVLFIEYYFLF
jgi:hypothetical protein